jgi:hypothetical protein
MFKLKRNGAAALLLAIVAMVCRPVVPAEGLDREAMADAMARMMDAMGFAGSGARSGDVPFAGGAGMDQARRWGQSMMDGLGHGTPEGSAAALDGLWEAAGGGLLIVRDGRYRLYAPNGGFADGSLATSGESVRMWNRTAGFAVELEYALDQGRLALRDPTGQVYLYRQLVLPGGD